MKAPFLFFLTTGFLFTAFGKPTETYQDIIDKAFTLSLQKDRTHAVQILNQSLKKESAKGAPPQELLVALEEVAGTFYSDKAQQVFEQALSLKKTDIRGAQQRLGEALKLEADNFQILIEQVRLSILNTDCGVAQEQAETLFSLYSQIETARLILAQASVCNGKFEKSRQAREGIDTKKSPLQLFWNSVDAELAFKSGNLGQIKALADEASTRDPLFPELHYWRWKTESENPKQAEKAGQKYLSLCKSLSPRSSRKFMMEPLLCRRTAEVENFLKKNNSAGI